MTPAAKTLEREQKRAKRDALAMSMLVQLRAAGLEPWVEREYTFHHERKWRFDFAFPSVKVAMEVDGGIYSGGRHTRGKGFENDCEKCNEAAMLGWTVLRVTSHHIGTGQAIQWAERLVKR